MKNLISPRRANLLTDLSENFERLLSVFDNLPEAKSSALSSSNWVPKIDVKEQDNQYIIYADVPGMVPSDIEVSVDNGVLTIKGQKETEQKEEKDSYLRVERASGAFIRQMMLPDSIDATQIKAKSRHGVLEVRIPKAQQPSSNKITVESE